MRCVVCHADTLLHVVISGRVEASTTAKPARMGPTHACAAEREGEGEAVQQKQQAEERTRRTKTPDPT